jgi:hypothetical protein
MDIDLSSIGKDSRVVVFDSGGPHGVKNLVFDRAAVTERHGMSACFLYEACLRSGIQLLTPDLYLALPQKPSRALFVRTNPRETRETELLASGAYPAVFMAYEHPLYACEFYWHMGPVTGRFDHVFMPKGAGVWARPKVKFHGRPHPQPYTHDDRVHSNFSGKKYLTMISGNARIRPIRRWYVHFWNFIRPLPTLVDRELYVDRLEAIRYFADVPGFDLYGRGWESPVPYSDGRYEAAIRKSYRGEVADKFVALEPYKFSICFENCIFEGWITEKVIDSLLAGCIPVYWGATNILEYLDADTFIDFREFYRGSGPLEPSLRELDSFMRSMKESEYEGYIAAINRYIASEKFSQFTYQKFNEDLIALFLSYFPES